MMESFVSPVLPPPMYYLCWVKLVLDPRLNAYMYHLTQFSLYNKALPGVACEPKGHWVNSQSGCIAGSGARSLVGGV